MRVELSHWRASHCGGSSFCSADAQVARALNFRLRSFTSITTTISRPIGIASHTAVMPRSLARLRYRAPRAPVSFPLIDAANPLTAAQLERRVAQYVVRNSSPNLLRLQTVVNPKAKGLATGQWHPAPKKPFTLRDLVDPEGKRRHGEIIYVFRNSNSNQIIYSLQELLDVGY
jgi:hypothetical protein